VCFLFVLEKVLTLLYVSLNVFFFFSCILSFSDIRPVPLFHEYIHREFGAFEQYTIYFSCLLCENRRSLPWKAIVYFLEPILKFNIYKRKAGRFNELASFIFYILSGTMMDEFTMMCVFFVFPTYFQEQYECFNIQFWRCFLVEHWI